MKRYPKEVVEFIKVRLEQSPNNTQIARDVKNKFSEHPTIAEMEQDKVRRDISRYREKLKIDAKKIPIRRLFFDIETSYYELTIHAWQMKNFQRYFSHKDITREKEIICISYKWQYEDKVHTLDWTMGEKRMLKAFIKIMGEADECVAHNGDRFDIRFIRTRCSFHGVLMFPDYRSLDTLKKSRGGFLFASNSLEYLCTFFGIGGKLEHEGKELWDKVIAGCKDSLEKMRKYCERDVVMLEDLFFVLSPFIGHNNNFAVLTGGEKWECPECASADVKMYKYYSTPMGVIRRKMKCNQCKKQYKVSNKTYMLMLEHITREGLKE